MICLVVFGLGVGSLVAAAGPDLQKLQSVWEIIPPGRYLVLFQNNAEQRPSGGFIGSFAVVERTASGIGDVQIDTNIYKRDDAFTERTKIQPPEPLQRITDAWAMRDSNWDVDFRDAAQRVNWFFQQEGGQEVDGVIAINATVVQDVLQLTGPVYVPAWNQSISAESFFDVLHYKIEREYYYDAESRERNEPKTAISQLVPLLKERVLQPWHLVRVAKLAIQELDEKQILIYHKDPAVEEKITALGWAGAIDSGSDNYLGLVNASIGGQKSSLFMSQDIELIIGEDGLSHELIIKRSHTGTGAWPDARNENYLRILVPEQVQLEELTVDGDNKTDMVAISLEAGKTAFGTQFSTDPGTTSELRTTYRLRDGVNTDTLFYQKQPGTLADRITIRRGDTVLRKQIVTQDMQFEIGK